MADGPSGLSSGREWRVCLKVERACSEVVIVMLIFVDTTYGNALMRGEERQGSMATISDVDILSLSLKSGVLL